MTGRGPRGDGPVGPGSRVVWGEGANGFRKAYLPGSPDDPVVQLFPDGYCPGCGADAYEDQDRCPDCGRVFEADEPRKYGWREIPPPPALRFFSQAHGAVAVGTAGAAAVLWGFSLWLRGQLLDGLPTSSLGILGSPALALAVVILVSALVWYLTRPPRRSRAGWAVGVAAMVAYVVLVLVAAVRSAMGAEGILDLVTAGTFLAVAGFLGAILAVGWRARRCFGSSR